jgi:hypothetical protein
MRKLLSLLALTLCLVMVTAVAASPIPAPQATASYTIVLGIGPVETMLMPDQAMGATTGEVMAPMPGMPMPTMVMTDHGQPVNHHLEVHITNKATGAVVVDPMPMITITDAMGTSRALDSMAMYGVTEGVSDWHFGNSVYLPDGTYTISVQVGNEQTVFTSLMVTGEVAMAPMPVTTPMPAMAPMPMPMAYGPGMHVIRRLGDG